VAFKNTNEGASGEANERKSVVSIVEEWPHECHRPTSVCVCMKEPNHWPGNKNGEFSQSREVSHCTHYLSHFSLNEVFTHLNLKRQHVLELQYENESELLIGVVTWSRDTYNSARNGNFERC